MVRVALVLAISTSACGASNGEETPAAPLPPAPAASARAPATQSPAPAAPGAGTSDVRRTVFEDLREAWPNRLCGVATSGVPTAVRVEACNCGETLACRIRQDGGVVHVEVREDPATMTACDDCLPARTTCPSLEPLPVGHATISVNGRAQIEVETSERGALPPERCWDLPIVRPTGR